MEPPTLQGIIDAMMTPEDVTPEQIVHYYTYLTAIYARHSVELCDALADAARQEAVMLQDEEITSARVKQLVKGTEAGQGVIRLTGRLKAIEELIRSLKTAQKYHLEDARNTL